MRELRALYKSPGDDALPTKLSATAEHANVITVTSVSRETA
jgi:hypothetical protein